MSAVIRVPAETPAWRERYDIALRAAHRLTDRQFVYRDASDRTWRACFSPELMAYLRGRVSP